VESGTMVAHLGQMQNQPSANAGARQSAAEESALRAAVSQRLGEARFGRWFGDGVRLALSSDGDALEVRVPDAFFRAWIQNHYSVSLREAAEAVAGRPVRLSIQVHNEPQLPFADKLETRPPQGEPKILSGRIPKRLEDFVIGPGNLLAHAAAQEMAHSAGAAFNPLLIHSGVGLGKTHLLEGIGHALRLAHPTRNILQLTAEAFTNSFLEAMREGSLNSFRARVRHAGALLVDEIHFLAAKRATQDEFLHTFNALIDKGAPIILSADQHPRSIARLSEELITRFLGGMIVKIEAPDLATRRAILQTKAAMHGVLVPEPVIGYIADHLHTSIRELEGALQTVIAQAALTGRRVDLNFAQAALKDTIRHTVQAVGLRDVERVVCQSFQISAEALRSDSRARALAYPRMLAMYLARKHTGAAYTEIGRYFGGRNHSTVISAEKKVAKWLRAEEDRGNLPGFESVADLLSNLERALGTINTWERTASVRGTSGYGATR
jgi:chromosomal replication initiator protein